MDTPTAAPHPLKDHAPIGLIGAGQIGMAIAGALSDAGGQIVIYTRESTPITPALPVGVRLVTRLEDLADCSTVISALPDDNAVLSCMGDPGALADCLGPEALHLCVGTISPEAAASLAELHGARQQHFASAPILGNPLAVRSAQAFVLLAGSAVARARAIPLIATFSQRHFELGDDPAMANLFKLASNALTANTLQAMAEVIALLRKAGLPAERAFEVLNSTMFNGRVHTAYGARIVRQQYQLPGLSVALAAKDLGLALAAAGDRNVPMPATQVVHQRLTELRDGGGDRLDWSALGALAAFEAGLESLP